MKRTLFGTSNLTAESLSGGETIESIAATIHQEEILGLVHEADIDINETVSDVAEHTTESLGYVSSVLSKKDNINQQTFEALVASVNTSSGLLQADLTIESVTADAFAENKDQLISDLEETVEGFIGDITASVGTLAKRIGAGTKNVLTSLFTRQKALGKLADKLAAKMRGRSEGDVSNDKVRVRSANKWFETQDACVEKMKTYNGLRANMPAVQQNLIDLPTQAAENDMDVDKFKTALYSGISTFAKAPGVTAETASTKEGDIKYIKVPIEDGKSIVLGALRTTAVVGVGLGAGSTAAAAIIVKTGLLLTGSVPLFVGTFVASVIAVGAATNWILKKSLPAMSWSNITSVLEEVSGMASTDLSLSGMSKALANVEKASKKITEVEKKPKSQLKGFIKVIRAYSGVFRSIYSKSVACARAAVAYASASLKKHLKGGEETTQSTLDADEFYQDVCLLNDTFEAVDDLTDPSLDEEPATA